MKTTIKHLPIANRVINKVKLLRDAKANYYRRIVGYYPWKCGDMTFKCDTEHMEFWEKVNNGIWEPSTFNIYSRFLIKDSTYCDIGAWIGPTVLYASVRSMKVICFEPDLVAYKYLLHNININQLHNVLPFNIALSDFDGTGRMSSFAQSLGDSASSLLNTDKAKESIEVLCLTWSNWHTIVKPGKIDFMKIDIEGGEFSLLPTMKDYLTQEKPILYLSIHAPYIEATKRAQQLQKILPIFDIYPKCFDEDMQPIQGLELKSQKTFNSFRSFLFTM